MCRTKINQKRLIYSLLCDDTVAGDILQFTNKTILNPDKIR